MNCQRHYAIAICRILVMIGTALLCARGLADGGFRYQDAPRHALSGVFLMDAVRDAAWTRPVAYAEEYYARYPGLCIPNYAPPLFHSLEALFFTTFGVSVVTARHAVLFIHVLAVLVLFEIVRLSDGLVVGLLACGFFVTSPVVADWSRCVVLEPAATCAMLASVLWLLRGKWATLRGTLVGVLLIAACLLTKQTTVFIVGIHLVYLAIYSPWKGRSRTFAWCSAVGLAVLLAGSSAYWAICSPYQIRALWEGTLAWRLAPSHWGHSALRLPATLGIPGLALALVGAAYWCRRGPRTQSVMLFSIWSLGFCAMMAILSREGDRYSFLWMPALAYFAAAGMRYLWELSRYTLVRGALLMLVLVPISLREWQATTRHMDGHEQAAAWVSQLPGGTCVLYDGLWDGDFVFFWRQYEPGGRYALRGSKSLYTFASYPWIGYEEYARSATQLLELLRRYGVRYLVLEDIDHEYTTPGMQLRQLVQTSDFRLRARVRLSKRRIGLRAEYLDIYEFEDAGDATAEYLPLSFPGLGKRIQVPLRPAPTRGS